MKRSLSVLFAVIAVLVFATTAAAANPQFRRNGSPTLTDNGSTLSITAAMTGLGNGNLDVDIAWTGTTIGNTCTSPGGNDAPGQNPATPVGGTASFSFAPSKNGNVVISGSTTAPTITPQQAGCPNGHWSASYTDVVFTSAHVTIDQATSGFHFECDAVFPSGGTTNGGTYACV
jgi:hypothetical protein